MDGLDIEIEGDSEPAVALALLKIVMRAEGKDAAGVDGAWILATLSRCLAAVMGEAPPDDDEDAQHDDDDDDDDAAESDPPAHA
ncbi:hypothetical protein [Roseomonas fluvialis]|uniref:Uncharacterized protein n=1 Tax=Roseomonas fluvialis TaxID=1750527 RepID=A0ABM7XZ81_9PROT|nr:hypothetical protein [Roseomonas fluvialis]BDG70810.1 hypothetical protein Rmf_07390 [Roseomonas fluvialis]